MPEDRGPGVRLPPPVIVVAALILAWGLQRLLPLQLGPPAVALGGMVIFLAMGWVGWALLVLVRAGNDPRPDKPDQVFVTGGPYRLGRNPIYFGFLLFLAGVALSWGTLWAWLAVGGVFLALDLYVVRREEAYLRSRFPEAYPPYLARTRRWL
ncbi:MAG: isoprenylcysteine carboxylmethyltransferase family protein [Roseococcus sp.]